MNTSSPNRSRHVCARSLGYRRYRSAGHEEVSNTSASRSYPSQTRGSAVHRRRGGLTTQRSHVRDYSTSRPAKHVAVGFVRSYAKPKPGPWTTDEKICPPRDGNLLPNHRHHREHHNNRVVCSCRDRQIYESVVAGLIVQARWELAIDPTRRKLFRRAITIGLRKPDDWLYRHKVAVLSRVMRNGGAAQASLSAGDTATCDHAISGECISGTTRVPA
jgi:hypothetical protein